MIQLPPLRTERLYPKPDISPIPYLTDSLAKALTMTEKADFTRPNYRNAHFFISASTLSQCPPAEGLLEVAFIGRSNAGKSSAINKLTEQHKLARTSKTPGRTQLLNFFQVAEGKYLVDLPGFGYAKVPVKVKAKWQKQLELYLHKRDSLQGLVLLMDIRHPFKEFDQMMIDQVHESGMPLHVLLTKADKVKRGAAKTTLLQAQQHLAQYGDHMTVQLFSSLKGDGVKDLRRQLDVWLRTPEPEESTDTDEQESVDVEANSD